MSHSNIVGGSTAGRVLQCPGSIKLSQAAPDRGSSVHADRGTMLHSCMEYWMDFNEWPAVGEPPVAALPDQVLTEELLEEKLRPAARAYIEFEAGFGGQVEVLTERRVDLSEIDGGFGTMDVVLQGDRQLGLVDWKFGDGVIVNAGEDKINPQLGFGLIGVLDEIDGWADKWDLLRVAIIQPARGAEVIMTTYDVEIEELKVLYTDLYEAVVDGLSGEPRFAEGGGCRFCPGQVNCPLMSSQFHALEVVKNDVIEVAGMDNETLSALLDKADYVQDFIKACQAEAVERIQEGADIPEWKLVAKRVTRKYEDEAEAETWARDFVGKKRGGHKIRVGDLFKQVIKSPAQLEKVVKETIPSKLLHQGEPGVTLARADDRRPALTFNLSKQLEEL